MKFLVIQHRQSKPNDAYVPVARCATAPDAILFAAALARAQPNQGCVQVYRIHRGRHAYNLLCVQGCGQLTDQDVRKALDTHGAREKQWRAGERTEKALAIAQSAYFCRFKHDDTMRIIRTPDISRLLHTLPLRVEEADARAAELGIYPSHASDAVSA